jgi:hypothetical protein
MSHDEIRKAVDKLLGEQEPRYDAQGFVLIPGEEDDPLPPKLRKAILAWQPSLPWVRRQIAKEDEPGDWIHNEFADFAVEAGLPIEGLTDDQFIVFLNGMRERLRRLIGDQNLARPES